MISNETIAEMRAVRDKLIGTYTTRDAMLKRYDEIFFMTRAERPRELVGVDKSDIKETISSAGRDAVIGLKRILDSGDVHISIEGEGGNKEKIERGLKQILRVSGEYRIAAVEKDLNLSAALYGPGIASVESVDDLIETLKYPEPVNGKKYKNEYVKKQLDKLKTKTPFIIHTINPAQSYPLWGAYGMIGHVRVYKLTGAEITNKWGVECKEPTKLHEVKDFYYYENRLVEAEGISEPLMADEWVARDKSGEIIGSINIPVFARHAGGSNLFNEPEKQSQPLLYAKAKGEWDLRENLYFTYLFTAIYQQGLPGPLILIKPDQADQEVNVNFRNGVRTMVVDGQIADNQVIDGDVIQLGNILKDQSATQTIQPQTLGQSTGGTTFSQFAMASKAGLIPAIDPKESQEALYADIFTHILERIKAESIENEIIGAGDIPENFKLTVTIEPDLEQDDLRNAQIGLQLSQSGLASNEWINTNILKIQDNDEMWRQRKLEEMRDAMAQLLMSPEMLQPFVQKIMEKFKGKAAGGQATPPATPPEGTGQTPPELPGQGAPMTGMEQLPKTDAMILPEERM